MPVEVGQIAGWATVLVALLSLAFTGLQRSTIMQLRESNGDLRADNKDKDEREVQSQQKIAELTADNAALGRVVTGEVHWTALGDRLEEHHREAEKHWSANTEMLESIYRELRRRESRDA